MSPLTPPTKGNGSLIPVNCSDEATAPAGRPGRLPGLAEAG